MSMSFPDMESRLMAAEVWKFRQPEPVESEAAYCAALADHVEARDFLEAHEIRTGRCAINGSSLAWPRRVWITRISTSCSRRWVAKLCRSVCGDTRFLIPAAWAAARTARQS
jgi:hypothetical protein